MAKFEKVSRFKDVDLPLPSRSTECAAGYDFVVAEDIVIPPYRDIMSRLPYFLGDHPKTLQEIAESTKKHGAKPTLVSTGMKCELHSHWYLELSVRSSTPLKHWLILANGVGIIDADYYNNEDNEGEIFFQLINLSPYPIFLKRGDKIGQGIIKEYLRTEDDAAGGKRGGGFGSTDRKTYDRNQIHAKMIASLENKSLEELVRNLSTIGIEIYDREGSYLPKPTSLILDEITKLWQHLGPREQGSLLYFLGDVRDHLDFCSYFNGPYEYSFENEYSFEIGV